MDTAAAPCPEDGRAVAVVPLKALDRAKGRLGTDLPPAGRRALTAWMLERVLRACGGAGAVAETLVVAGDEQAAELARGLGAAVVVEPRPTLATALTTADRVLGRAAASLVVTADLPLVTPSSLDQVVAAAPASGPAVVVAESVDGGTSVLFRRPATVVGTGFGPGSARVHLDLAAHAGVPALCVRDPVLALDVDDTAALRAAADRSPELAAWLAAHGLGLRAAAS